MVVVAVGVVVVVVVVVVAIGGGVGAVGVVGGVVVGVGVVVVVVVGVGVGVVVVVAAIHPGDRSCMLPWVPEHSRFDMNAPIGPLVTGINRMRASMYGNLLLRWTRTLSAMGFEIMCRTGMTGLWRFGTSI